MGKLIAAGCTGALAALSVTLVTTAVAQAPKPTAAANNLLIAASGNPVAWVVDLDKRMIYSCLAAGGAVACNSGKIP